MAGSTARARALALLACVSLGACLSQGAADLRSFTKAPLYGMVYDDRNEPCQGVLIRVDGAPGPTTDLSGRFVVADLARGAHAFSGEKTGYERLDARVDFADMSQVLYLKMISLDHLLERLEQALAERKLAEASALLARAQAVDGGHADVRYLEALHLLKSGEPRPAAELLEKMLASGERAPALYITLADIYQYALGDTEKARSALAAYLGMQEDAQARSRLEALK